MDTNALLFALREPKKLSKKAEKAITTADGVYYSAESLWEIGLKHCLGKFDNDSRVVASAARDAGFQALDISLSDIHAMDLVNDFPHRDPFDLLIVATSKDRLFPLVNSDTVVREYLKNVIW